MTEKDVKELQENDLIRRKISKTVDGKLVKEIMLDLEEALEISMFDLEKGRKMYSTTLQKCKGNTSLMMLYTLEAVEDRIENNKYLN